MSSTPSRWARDNRATRNAACDVYCTAAYVRLAERSAGAQACARANARQDDDTTPQNIQRIEISVTASASVSASDSAPAKPPLPPAARVVGSPVTRGTPCPPHSGSRRIRIRRLRFLSKVNHAATQPGCRSRPSASWPRRESRACSRLRSTSKMERLGNERRDRPPLGLRLPPAKMNENTWSL